MKKQLLGIILTSLSLCLCACSLEDGTVSPSNVNVSEESTTPVVTSENYYKSIDEASIESISEHNTPVNMAAYMGGCQMTYTYSSEGNELLDGLVSTVTYVNANGITHCNVIDKYTDMESKAYFSNDENDMHYYRLDGTEISTEPFSKEEADEFFMNSVTGYENASANIIEAKEENGSYLLTVKSDRDETATDYLTIDPVSGFITKFETSYEGKEGQTKLTITLDYSSAYKVDLSLKDGSSSASEEAVAATQGDFTFNTTDINGNPVSYSDYSDAKLILVNFWEPWCGPCVGEMPDLQKLYEKYKDQGFLILGVYSTFDMDSDAKDLIAAKKITYPILKECQELVPYETNAVPTTILVDGNGNVLTDEAIVGAMDYDEWESIIKKYLNN